MKERAKTKDQTSLKSPNKVPVVILNGFLGSGKTTFFRKLLSQSKKKNIPVCAIVNDMSELDVDGRLIGNTNIVEENAGMFESIYSCVLSSKLGIQKLDQALNKLLSIQSPKLVIIETSGSCHPMPLVEYFKTQTKTQLKGVFAFVDSLMLAHDFNFGENLVPSIQQNLAQGKRDTVNLLVEQIMFCNHLILTKADRIEENKVKGLASAVHQINPYAPVYSVYFGNFAIEALFKLKDYDFFKVAELVKELKPVLESEEQSDKPYDIATRVIKDDRPFHPQRLWDVCHQFLDKRIYRSKGFFWLATRDKHSLLWNQAAGGINLEIIGSWRSGIVEDENHGISEMEIEILNERLANESGRFGDRHCDLTVIGDKAQVDRFTNALKSCFLSDDEIKLWNEGHTFEDPWPKNIVRMDS